MRQFFIRPHTAALAFVAIFACAHSADAAFEHWRFGNGEDGLVIASLFATNKLVTGGGALSYSPSLTIGCHSEGEPRWTEWLQLNDAVSASKTIVMSVTIDGHKRADENWLVGQRGKVLVIEGKEVVKRLLSADDLTLSWRFGLLSGRGVAQFDLDGIDKAIEQIAAACNATVP